MTTQDLTAKAIAKLEKRSLSEVFRYIDEQLPLPTCVNERGVVNLKRKRVKENVQAAMRQTKVTGPSLTK